MSTKDTKTQAELETLVKGYQLEALANQVTNLAGQVKDGFSLTNTSINALLVKSESQVTPQQLTDNIAALKVSLEDQIEGEIKKIHLEYGPLKENNKWFIRFIATQAAVMVGQLVFIVYVTRGG